MAYVYNNIIVKNGRVITNAKGQLLTDDGNKTVAKNIGAVGEFLKVGPDSNLDWSAATLTDLNIVDSATIYSDNNSLKVNSSITPGQPLLSSGSVGTEAVYGSLDLSSSSAVTGLLPVTKGGTGNTTFNDGFLIISDGIKLVSSSVNLNDLPILTGEVITLSATPTLLYPIQTEPNKAYVIKATILAKQTDLSKVASFSIVSTWKNVSGTVTQIGDGFDLIYTPADIPWSVNITPNSEAIDILVLGDSNEISWKIKIDSLVTI